MLARLIPIRNEKRYRFLFKNMWLEERKPSSVKFNRAEAQFEVVGEQLMVLPKRALFGGACEVALNGQPIDGPRPLANGDLVALRDNSESYFNIDAPIKEQTWPKGVQVIYVFESDLHLAKMTRWHGEASGDLRRNPPDLTSEVAARLRDRIVVDETGVTLITKTWTRPKARLLGWDELDAIKFEASLNSSDWGGDAVAAAAHGVQLGLKVADYWHADRMGSNGNPVFHAPVYGITFRYRGKSLDGCVGRADECDWIAQAIEYHAPIDLIWFGDADDYFKSPIQSATAASPIK
jgi:hypothetical protein